MSDRYLKNLLYECNILQYLKTGPHVPWQVLPSPLYPDLQLQWNDPITFEQSAFGEQSWVDTAHSLTSRQELFN